MAFGRFNAQRDLSQCEYAFSPRGPYDSAVTTVVGAAIVGGLVSMILGVSIAFATMVAACSDGDNGSYFAVFERFIASAQTDPSARSGEVRVRQCAALCPAAG